MGRHRHGSVSEIVFIQSVNKIASRVCAIVGGSIAAATSNCGNRSAAFIALSDGFHLGVLSSAVHVFGATRTGGTLEDRPRYNKTKCFEPFPFPASNEEQQKHLNNLGEQLNAHRKRQQTAHPDLTLTGMYNVLDKLRSGEPLSAKERTIHEHGLVSVLRQLHDEIDAAVLDAYGGSDLLPLLCVAYASDTLAYVGAASAAMPSPHTSQSIATEVAPTIAAS